MKTLRFSVLLSALFAIGIAATQAVAQTNTAQADAFLSLATAAEEQASNSESADMKFEAARLHLESARLRPEGDPKAIASMRTAAFYLSYSEPEHAANLLSDAAGQAMNAGDLVTAADIYVDAANVLVGSRNKRVTASDFARAQTWLSQAATLATNSQFSATDRARITRRVGLDVGKFAG